MYMFFYLPRTFRKVIVLRLLLLLEFPFTVATLALTGISHPNLYRTKLWQDGYENGFNSAPIRQQYAMANYRPYSTPHPWAQFTTSFCLVVSVLSTFFWLVKVPLHLMKVWYPPFSVVIHAALCILYCVGAAYMGGPDTTDPEHRQPGPPWYVTKSCSVAKLGKNVGYCQQAKSLFALFIILAGIFAIQLFYSLYCCLPTEEDIATHKQEKDGHRQIEMLKAELKSPAVPKMPADFAFYSGAGLPIATPRTATFGAFPQAGRTNDEHESKDKGKTVETHVSTVYPPPPSAAAVKALKEGGNAN